MSALTELKLYLLDKLDSTNTNNPKCNGGAALLKLHDGYEEEMEDFLALSIQTMQRLFTKTTSDSPAGESPLTNMSMKIGYHLLSRMD